MQEALERFRRVQPFEDAAVFGRIGRSVHALDPFLDPGLLFVFLDVHVLDADGPGVGVAEHAEDVAQWHGRAVDAARAETADRELAVEVPDAETVVADVELGMGLGNLAAERVEVGDQMAADPVHVDELVDVDDLLVLRCGVRERAAVRAPARRLVRDSEAAEHRVVEAVGAEQEVVDATEELAALRAADDPVVVGVGQRRDRADAELREGRRVGSFELGGDPDRADAEDEALAGHQPGDRVHRPDHPGVGDRARRAREVLDRDLVGPDPPDELFVRGSRTRRSPSCPRP